MTKSDKYVMQAYACAAQAEPSAAAPPPKEEIMTSHQTVPPTPWRFATGVGQAAILQKDGTTIAWLNATENTTAARALANTTEFIVRAVNNYSLMLSALTELDAALRCGSYEDPNHDRIYKALLDSKAVLVSATMEEL